MNILIPNNEFEWFGLILFIIATPLFFWFLFREFKRSKRTKNAGLGSSS